jgi:vitamin B12 transporter
VQTNVGRRESGDRSRPAHHWSALPRAKEDILSFVRRYYIRFWTLLLFWCLFLGNSTLASPQGALHGQVLDPLGAAVPDAKVTLVRNKASVSTTKTNQQGKYELSQPDSGRYSLHVEATGFQNQDSPSAFMSATATVSQDVRLQIGPLTQQVVVSATGSEIPDSQVGASISVIDHSQLQDLNKLDILEDLRTVSGVQVVQTGQRGGTTSVSILGGNKDFNKVLLDGIPMNDIGGDLEFANIATGGVESVEILRGANSVLYGTDALGGVINLTTRRGTTTIPELTYSGDGGNFGAGENDVSIAGAFHQFDYLSEFSLFDTRNSVPNSAFHNGTYAGNFGWAVNGSTEVRLTVRHTAVGLGDPNALDFYGIPDNSSQKEQDTYWGITLRNQTTKHWRNLVRFASTQLKFQFVNPSPTGIPADGNFLGDTITIRGANGYSVTGQAILDFGGTYPQTFGSSTTRRSLYAQSDYDLRSNLTATAGFRYENENGFTNSQGSISPVDRNNFSYFLVATGNLRHRLFATVGVDLDVNAVFGFAVVPRVSLAYYVRKPSSGSFLGDTKVGFNFGKGIKEPSIFDSGSSLFSVLSQLPQGPALISQFGIAPIGPERSTSFSYGITQALWNRRANLSVDFFHNQFYNLIEFLGGSSLPLLGFPQDVVNAVAASGPGGATVNSESYRALGAEVRVEVDLGHGLRVGGNYTYLDPVVTQTSSNTRVFNPAFPGIPIGASGALVGNRPFRMAPHSGGFHVDYDHRRVGMELTAYLVTRQDGSTFLGDASFGTSMLLPNHDLNPGYQKIDLSGRYAINSAVTLFTSVENLLDEHYTAVFGFPALPLTFRAGLKVTIGGEGWRPK